MARDATRSARQESSPVESEANGHREKFKRMRRLPVLVPVEDRDDATHNVLVRVLGEAEGRGEDLAALITRDPDIVAKKLEAERSRVRRARRRLARQMSDEMAEVLPAEMALTEAECAEVIEELTSRAGLSTKDMAQSSFPDRFNPGAVFVQGGTGWG
jgi:hypothetical protein